MPGEQAMIWLRQNQLADKFRCFTCEVEFLDGMQNILPANITSLTQNTFSPLLDAYKRSEVTPRRVWRSLP